LVNCAGYARSGNSGDIPFEEEAGMIELHGISYLKMTHVFLPWMKKNNHGCIVNLSSISAFQPNPTLAVYGASKAFVYNWSMSLRAELKATHKNIQVQTICPTPVVTNFQKNAKMENSILFNTWMTVTPELVANEIIRAIKKNKGMIVPGKIFHWTNKFVGRLPVQWRIWISSLHLKTKKKNK
jgi:short-subunit dehydrogenase